MDKANNRIYGEFWSFGPHQNSAIKNKIILRFLNGKSTTIELNDITDRIKPLTNGGEIIVTQRFIITGGDGGAGFTPDVDDWDEKIILLPI